MSCSQCETAFQDAQSVVVTIMKSGPDALLYVRNQGRHIVHLRRIVVCYATPGSAGFFFLRPPGDAVPWLYPSAFLEQGGSALFYKFTPPDRATVEAQAEFVELSGRSRSCAVTF